jgi:hypothetical protein
MSTMCVIYLNFFVRMLSTSLSLAFAHTGTMAPQTAKQQVANLLIQVSPKEHFSLYVIHLTSIEYRGMAWYAKLRIERETADKLLARLVIGDCKLGPTSLGQGS